MSYQTKKQSIGYMIIGFLDTGIEARKLKGLIEEAVEVVCKRNDISNNDTLDYVNIIANKIGLNEEEKRDLRSCVYWAFDGKTVSEAGSFAREYIRVKHYSQLKSI